jgi:hypothetical protein
MKFFEIDEEYLKKGGLITREVYNKGVSYGLNEGCLVRFYLGKIVKPIKKFIGYEEDLLASDWLYVGPSQKEKWSPKFTDKFYYISATGHVLYDTFMPYASVDIDKLNFNNVFKDEKDAESMLNKLRIINKLQSLSNVKFNNCDKEKYVIYYDSTDNKIEITYHMCVRESPFEVYFTTREDCVNAIKEIGEENLKKYYFDVDD